jgi:hypothetical protein
MGSITEQALARWFAHGVTSTTHPVLHFAFAAFLHPLGVISEALEMEPFSGLESGSGEWWLRDPSWSPASFDRRCPSAEDFGYLLEAPDHFEIKVSSRGWLAIILGASGKEDLSAQAYLAASEGGWLAARHAVEAARKTESFLWAAASLLLVDESLSESYVRGADQEFCAAVLHQLDSPSGKRLP